MKESKENKDKSLEDIFDTDFIELNIEGAQKELGKKENEELKPANDKVFTDKDTALFSDLFYKTDEEELKKYSENYTIEENKPKKDILKENKKVATIPKKKVNKNKKKQSEKKKTIKKEPKKKPVKKKKTKKNLSIKFYTGVIVIIAIVTLIAALIYFLNKERVVVCSFEAEDIGYKMTDEYKITYKRNDIIYVDETYKYKAKEEEYKKQLELIKKEKVPVIINSNGMPGFTYVYDISDNNFKISSYLDFKKFEFDKIKKINQDVSPISYFKIDSKLNYKTLKKNMEKQGYVCTKSK